MDRPEAYVRCRAKYRGLNTDLSRIDEFRLHENDVGSSVVQVARFTARVTQLTEHLKAKQRAVSFEHWNAICVWPE